MSLEPWFILIVVAVLILAFGAYVLLYRKKHLSSQEMKKVKMHWAEIHTLLNDRPEQAIMKADKLLDHTLKKAGYQGSMGEKMKAARGVFRDNNGLWSAHKLRNRIAHEIDIQVSPQQAKSALNQFKRAFADLGIDL